MSRPIWKGNIVFGLVNIPVILFSGEKKFDIQFKLVDKRDQAKIHYVRVNEDTGEEVPWENIAKGYKYDSKNFVLLEEKDLQEIAGENTKTIEIDSFVDKGDVDPMLFDKAYYLVPDKKGEKAYVILRDTLRETEKIGIASLAIHSRHYLAAVMPYQNALIVNLMHYIQEIRQPDEFDLPSDSLKKYKISAKEFDLAKQLVKAMSTKWKPGNYQDDFRINLEKFINKKIQRGGKKRAEPKKVAAETKDKSNVVDLFSTLKKSLAIQKPGTRKTR